MSITWSTPGAHDELLQDADPLKPKRKQTNMPFLRKRTILKSSLPKPYPFQAVFRWSAFMANAEVLCSAGVSMVSRLCFVQYCCRHLLHVKNIRKYIWETNRYYESLKRAYERVVSHLLSPAVQCAKVSLRDVLPHLQAESAARSRKIGRHAVYVGRFLFVGNARSTPSEAIKVSDNLRISVGHRCRML